MNLETLTRQLRAGFCGGLRVRAVPHGFAVGAAFTDQSGDPIGFYIVERGGVFTLEDDGSYLSELVARDIPIDQGQRAQMLNAILQQGGAAWDQGTYEIRSGAIKEHDLPRRAVDFLSSLIRVRDLELLTREAIRSTFREDALAAFERVFGGLVTIEEDAPPTPQLQEFPSDIVIRPRVPAPGSAVGAVYLVNSNDKLNEALLLQAELGLFGSQQDVAVIGVIEDADLSAVSRRRFQRAQNRSLMMPIFRGDEDAAAAAVARRIGLLPLFASAPGYPSN